MKPKQKAEKIIQEILKDCCNGCDMPYCDVSCLYMDTEMAKPFAQIVVNNMIDAISPWCLTKQGKNDLKYLKEVKTEIQKL